MVRALTEHLPEYEVVTSGNRGLAGTLNMSGLVTLSRLPVLHAAFHPFDPLPSPAKTVERLGRKGYLVTDIDIGAEPVTLVNLHLYSAHKEREKIHTTRQLAGVVAFTERLRASGRRVLVIGDFNLDPEELSAELPRGWGISRHGPTYIPAENPYTARGANNTSGNHVNRLNGGGVRTVDFLVDPAGIGTIVSSAVLARPVMSDHQFLQHIVRREPALARMRADDVLAVPVGMAADSEVEEVPSLGGAHH